MAKSQVFDVLSISAQQLEERMRLVRESRPASQRRQRQLRIRQDASRPGSATRPLDTLADRVGWLGGYRPQRRGLDTRDADAKVDAIGAIGCGQVAYEALPFRLDLE